MKIIKPFIYIPRLDCFVVKKEFQDYCDRLRLTEWNAVVWMGRLFARDQDFGEHWFDNWEERSELCKKAKNLGISLDEEEFFIIVPNRFLERDACCIYCKDSFNRLPCPNCGKEVHVGADGPCYSDELKKRFWTDVLDSIMLSIDTLFALARESSVLEKSQLEKEIKKIKKEINDVAN